jgi:sugar lactone lactonase YvrE
MGRRIAIVVFVAAVAMALAPAAGAYVYWTNANGTIGRAELDGTGADQAFITGPTTPFGVAVDAKHIYWTDDTENAIGRANIDGTGIEEGFIPATVPRGVAVDSNHIYWTNNTGTIGRANLDGTGVDQSFITGATQPYGLAIDSKHLYWANYGTDSIGRANLDGTGATPNLFSTAPGTPQGVAVDADHVYWADYQMVGPSAIGRAGPDGSDPEPTFIPGLSDPYGIAVDRGHIYWLGGTSAVSRANLDGSAIESEFITADSPWGVTVDSLPDRSAPNTRISKAPPRKTKKRTVRVAFRASEAGSTFECRLDGSKWRPCDSPKKLRKLDRGRHAFQVRATDPAGNTDPTSAKARFKAI